MDSAGSLYCPVYCSHAHMLEVYTSGKVTYQGTRIMLLSSGLSFNCTHADRTFTRFICSLSVLLVGGRHGLVFHNVSLEKEISRKLMRGKFFLLDKHFTFTASTCQSHNVMMHEPAVTAWFLSDQELLLDCA